MGQFLVNYLLKVLADSQQCSDRKVNQLQSAGPRRQIREDLSATSSALTHTCTLISALPVSTPTIHQRQARSSVQSVRGAAMRRLLLLVLLAAIYFSSITADTQQDRGADKSLPEKDGVLRLKRGSFNRALREYKQLLVHFCELHLKIHCLVSVPLNGQSLP